jgi:hypothetical protein
MAHFLVPDWRRKNDNWYTKNKSKHLYKREITIQLNKGLGRRLFLQLLLLLSVGAALENETATLKGLG